MLVLVGIHKHCKDRGIEDNFRIYYKVSKFRVLDTNSMSVYDLELRDIAYKKLKINYLTIDYSSLLNKEYVLINDLGFEIGIHIPDTVNVGRSMVLCNNTYILRKSKKAKYCIDLRDMCRNFRILVDVEKCLVVYVGIIKDTLNYSNYSIVSTYFLDLSVY
jgi:hypothetical protein